MPMAHRRSRWKFGNWKSNDTKRQVTGGSIAIDSSSTTRVVVWFSWKEPTKKSWINLIPTWEVFMSFGNCETVFQLWLDQNWASSSWNGKILSYTTRPISCSSFCAHPNCFTGCCTFDLQDPNSFALTRCAAKSKFKSLLARRVLWRDSLMIAWASNLGAKHLTNVFQREQT